MSTTRERLAAGLARFGLASFRAKQEEICAAIVEGRSALAILPTGAGKSLCYQLPAIVRPGTALVISPLVALMQDQVASLTRRGVAAATINGMLDEEEREAAIERVAAGALDLLYVSPEMAVTHEFRDLVSKIPIALVAIDEAHCVSAWGHDFRPEYRQIPSLREVVPKGTPWIALTATADPDTKADIVESLALADALVIQTSFARPNIAIAAEPRGKDASAISKIRNVARRFPTGVGIVYCLARKTTERVARDLVRAGLPAVAFHAAMSSDAKRRILARFTSEKRIVVVATIAFGMGIDRADVRWVVHHDLPKGPESYSQEIGRAGRDGEPALALLLWGPRDVAVLRFFLRGTKSGTVRARESARLEAMVDLASNRGRCRRQAILAWFHETIDACGQCDVCLGGVERTLVCASAGQKPAPAGDAPVFERLQAARRRVAVHRRQPLAEIADDTQLAKIAQYLMARAAPGKRPRLPASLRTLGAFDAIIQAFDEQAGGSSN